MIDTMRPHRDRLDELLAEQALFGLSEEEQADLASLRARFPDTDADCFDRIAAGLLLAETGQSVGAMPESLQTRVRQQALLVLPTRRLRAEQEPESTATTPAASTSRLGLRERFAWALATAAVAAAVVLSVYPRSVTEAEPTVAELRQQAVRDTEDFVRVNWQTTGDPAAQSATGDVVWSNLEQRGYMRLCNLCENNPGECQYQLWIFDAERDDRYPIDGGVFDIRRDRPETIVPIRAKLRVLRPAMFAVTVERPGGVVVSKRERICLVAKLDG